MAKPDATRMDTLLDKLESLLPDVAPAELTAGAHRWQHSALGIGHLVSLPAWHPPSVDTLTGLDDECDLLRRNTKRFLAGKPANHAVLTGPRGCGKTTLVHGVAGEFTGEGLVVVRMSRELFHELPLLATAVARCAKQLLVICDELSFTEGGDAHLTAKAAMDDLEATGANILVYATSNRRHLVPEREEENLAATTAANGEIHPGETTEEKISLADRFGLWIPVFQPDGEQYLAMVQHHLGCLGKRAASKSELRQARLWAEERGSMNGRIARQFVRHLLGNR